MASKRKRSHEEEEGHENAERWLLTYADMITLLVAFFIMMYSMSVMDLKKFNKVALAIRSGFMGELSGTGTKPLPKNGGGIDRDTQPVIVGTAPVSTPYYGHADGTAEYQEKVNITQYIQNQFAVLRLDNVIRPVLDVTENEGNRFTVIVTDQIFFERNSAALSPAAREKLRTAGQALRKSNVKILIDGYAHAVATNTISFQDSWQLAAERARLAANFLVDEIPLNPRRLTIASHGEWKIPDRSKCLELTPGGEWKQLSTPPNTATIQDRIVLSLVLE
jgi:chemotaxis protein MotB